jgi:hypothetical protein
MHWHTKPQYTRLCMHACMHAKECPGAVSCLKFAQACSCYMQDASAKQMGATTHA